MQMTPAWSFGFQQTLSQSMTAYSPYSLADHSLNCVAQWLCWEWVGYILNLQSPQNLVHICSLEEWSVENGV